MSAERGHGSKSRVHFLGYSLIRCVGHGMGQAVEPHFDPHLKVHFYNEKHPKSEDFRCCSGAADQIRTGDLILTKDALYQLSYSSIGDPDRARTDDL